ncbi:hypothetical protein BJV74DRAFT_709397, partial [Russula compacta]
MAKSTRSKVKRAFRAKKRTEGVFAATEAARLQRLNAKLRALATTAIATARGRARETAAGRGLGQRRRTSKDFPEKPTGKISTHGPRGSRRDRWRASKGMKLRPKSSGMKRQGT